MPATSKAGPTGITKTAKARRRRVVASRKPRSALSTDALVKAWRGIVKSSTAPVTTNDGGPS